MKRKILIVEDDISLTTSDSIISLEKADTLSISSDLKDALKKIDEELDFESKIKKEGRNRLLKLL